MEEPVIPEPMDLIRLSLGERVVVKVEQDRQLRGRLHAYDKHMNLILGDVEETVTVKEIDEATFEEVYRRRQRNFPFLFIRGDTVILVSPLELRRAG